MPTKKRVTRIASRELPELVRHPRYGKVPIPSGTTLSAAEVRASFWQYDTATIFPDSAIDADITRQNFTIFPRGCYVDMLKVCRDCSRSFIFFAREQKHWYEVLRFYVDSDCVRCPTCRHSVRELRTRLQRYSEVVGRAEISNGELAVLVDDVVVLWEAGILKDEQRLRRLRNLAHRRLPATSKVTKRIDSVIAALKSPTR